MAGKHHTYIAIDLKSFYASVECRERNLDPLTTNLVVADPSRTEKTICLAVTPSLKAYGISGRARLFEVVERIKELNIHREQALGCKLTGSSINAIQLKQNQAIAIDYLVAPPRMKYYMDYSRRVYQIYLKYIAPEDIHVYSVDEVFIDVTHYLELYTMDAYQLVKKLIQDVLDTTGITATAGIGTNLYLCKIAMDILAKHAPPDQDGVRIAELNEHSYRQLLWDHRPLTDFWRVGRGYAKKLEANGLYTMGDIARCSLGSPNDYYNEDLLYRLFGINAELLIDHAWGWEPCTIQDIKAYQPETNSLESGQVLTQPYSWEQARLIVQEMTDQLALNLVDKGLETDQLILHVGYDRENLADPARARLYKGMITLDGYGRAVPKPARGTASLGRHISSSRLMMQEILTLYERIADKNLLVRRLSIAANHVQPKARKPSDAQFEQLNLFEDNAARYHQEQEQAAQLAREHQMQKAILGIQKRFGKNSILKGMDLEHEATTIARNEQVGGHKA